MALKIVLESMQTLQFGESTIKNTNSRGKAYLEINAPPEIKINRIPKGQTISPEEQREQANQKIRRNK